MYIQYQDGFSSEKTKTVITCQTKLEKNNNNIWVVKSFYINELMIYKHAHCYSSIRMIDPKKTTREMFWVLGSRTHITPDFIINPWTKLAV